MDVTHPLRWVVDRLVDVARHGETRPVELLTSFLTAVWGFWLLIPVTTFHTDAYRAMRATMPEGWWGLAYSLIGLGAWVAALTDSRAARGHGARSVALAWLFMGAMFVRSDVSMTATVVCPTVSVAAGWTYVRLARRASG